MWLICVVCVAGVGMKKSDKAAGDNFENILSDTQQTAERAADIVSM